MFHHQPFPRYCRASCAVIRLLINQESTRFICRTQADADAITADVRKAAAKFVGRAVDLDKIAAVVVEDKFCGVRADIVMFDEVNV